VGAASRTLENSAGRVGRYLGRDAQKERDVFVRVPVEHETPVSLADHQITTQEAREVIRRIGLRESGALRELRDVQRTVRQRI
jgi:hypothetical protein